MVGQKNKSENYGRKCKKSFQPVNQESTAVQPRLLPQERRLSAAEGPQYRDLFNFARGYLRRIGLQKNEIGDLPDSDRSAIGLVLPQIRAAERMRDERAIRADALLFQAVIHRGMDPQQRITGHMNSKVTSHFIGS